MRLDELLSEISKEPYQEAMTNNEVAYMRELSALRLIDYEEFVRYLTIYNEVRNAKLQDE